MSKGALFISVLLLPACTGEDGPGTTTFSTGTATATATASTTATATAGTDTDTTSSGTTAGTSSGTTTDATATATTTTTDSGGSSSGAGSTGAATTGDACGGNYAPGDWNACLNDQANVDNKQCMWMGTGDSVGIVGCLTSSTTENANTCFIDGCETVCDCFAPPATGTAMPICDAILEGGGIGCALDCSNGEICPDGMMCEGSICFWPPPA